jgi:hypothetical protein
MDALKRLLRTMLLRYLVLGEHVPDFAHFVNRFQINHIKFQQSPAIATADSAAKTTFSSV